MLYNFYQFTHNSLGLCFWDLPALAVAIIMIVVFAVHRHNQKKREKDFEDELKKKLEELQKNPENGETVKA